MVDILSDIPERSLEDVLRDLQRVLEGIGDGKGVDLLLSKTDFAILRGLAGRRDIMRRDPWLVRAMALNVKLLPDYDGPPRILGSAADVDVLAEAARREEAQKRMEWRDRNVRLRMGAGGQRIS